MIGNIIHQHIAVSLHPDGIVRTVQKSIARNAVFVADDTQRNGFSVRRPALLVFPCMRSLVP